MFNELNKYTFNYIIAKALAKVPNSLDKREGSIIYDALAPACYMLADYYLNLQEVLKLTFATSARGEYLNNRAKEQGISRLLATAAVRRLEARKEGALEDVEIGLLVQTNDYPPLTYEVIERVEAGRFNVVCHTVGIVGNQPIGEVSPLGPTTADSLILMDIVIPAREDETDEQLRQRYFDRLEGLPWGGNIIQYREIFKMQEGVGAVQIYPRWDNEADSRIVVSVLTSELEIPDEPFLGYLKEIIQPDNGNGLVPIGHDVSIVAPTQFNVNFQVTIELLPNTNPQDVEGLFNNALEGYLNGLIALWGNPDEYGRYKLSLRVADVIAALMSITEVVNVTNVLINGNDEDIQLTQDRDLQQLPHFESLGVNYA